MHVPFRLGPVTTALLSFGFFCVESTLQVVVIGVGAIVAALGRVHSAG